MEPKIMRNKRISNKIIIVLLIIIFLSLLVLAADYYKLFNGLVLEITEHVVCKKVANNCGVAIFIPTKTSAEWSAFRTYHPVCAALTDCESPQCSKDFECLNLYPDCMGTMHCQEGNCCIEGDLQLDCPTMHCIVGS